MWIRSDNWHVCIRLEKTIVCTDEPRCSSYYCQACCLLLAVFQSYIVAFINDLTNVHYFLYLVLTLSKLANYTILHQLINPLSGSQCRQPSCLSVNWESYSLYSSFLSQTQPKWTTLCIITTFVAILWWEAFLSPHKVEWSSPSSLCNLLYALC